MFRFFQLKYGNSFTEMTNFLSFIYEILNFLSNLIIFINSFQKILEDAIRILFANLYLITLTSPLFLQNIISNKTRAAPMYKDQMG